MPRIEMNLTAPVAVFERPEILQHPTIPGPMAGINPRTIFGREWWDVSRRAAYRRNRYCCWACGVHSSNAMYKQPLEAHEYYVIDYVKRTMTYIETVALCHMCHSFIHCGRMWAMYCAGEKEFPREKVCGIISQGLDILSVADLKPNWVARCIELMLGGRTESAARKVVFDEGLVTLDELWYGRTRWKLIYQGKELTEGMGP